MSSEYQEGVVTYVHPKKRYGFIEVEGMEQDVFFHKDRMPASIAELLTTGARVKVQIGKSKKGPVVLSVAI